MGQKHDHPKSKAMDSDPTGIPPADAPKQSFGTAMDSNPTGIPPADAPKSSSKPNAKQNSGPEHALSGASSITDGYGHKAPIHSDKPAAKPLSGQTPASTGATTQPISYGGDVSDATHGLNLAALGTKIRII